MIKRKFALSAVVVVLLMLAAAVPAQEVLHNFSGTDGANPRGPLLYHEGYMYGVTFTDITYHGVIYRIKPDGSDFEMLHLFDVTHGFYPNYGGVVTDGVRLYGMTSFGGSYSGVLYSMNFDGSGFTVLQNFTLSSGHDPYGAPYLVGDYIYGLTRLEGPSSQGTFYRVKKDGSEFTILKGFATSGPEGREPNSSMVSDGERFFFMTRYGGSANNGTISSIRPDGSNYQVLHSFTGAPGDGDYPGYSAPIIMGDNLYGLTAHGGTNNQGVIYKIRKDGTGYEVVFNASSVTDVSFGWQTGSLYEYKGDLYGLAYGGGANGHGAIFRFNPGGKTLEILASLDSTTGYNPRASLIYLAGYLYGGCYLGGANSYGTVFRFQVEPVRGDLATLLSPVAAVNAGAMWRLSFQEGWRQSGKKAKDLPAGTYTIVFKAIDGWKGPASQQINVTAGEEITVSGIYTKVEAGKQYGHLKVVLTPHAARKADAQWTVVGSGTWHNSGEKIQLQTGDVRIKFSPVKGFIKPEPSDVEIQKNTTSVLKKTYSLK